MFKITNTIEIYKNKWLSLREDKVIRPDGSSGTYGIVEMQDGVTVIAIDENNKYVVIEEYRYAIDELSHEFISGGIEVGEDVFEAAQRELKEEAGITAKKWEYIGLINPFTGIIKSKNHIYLARDLEFGLSSHEAGEIITHKLMTSDKIRELISNGKFTHGASCVGFWMSMALL